MGLFSSSSSSKKVTNRTTNIRRTYSEVVSGTKAGGDVAGLKAGGDVVQGGGQVVRSGGGDVGLTGDNFARVAESVSRTFRQGVAQLGAANVAVQTRAEDAEGRARILQAGGEAAAAPERATSSGTAMGSDTLMLAVGVALAATLAIAYVNR